ncbi:hypothetical protein PspLS_09917 [Pyricularia sp. CBS 133598]|nr:hypothetical protein PspLS_09917 [Pyricularia sp. CBS 133598]
MHRNGTAAAWDKVLMAKSEQAEAGASHYVTAAPSKAPPNVKVVLIQRRRASSHAPLFMFPTAVLSVPYMCSNRPASTTHRTLHAALGRNVSALSKQAILDTQPTGNFLLAGYSGGAICAYDTARQLFEPGHEVQSLLLFAHGSGPASALTPACRRPRSRSAADSLPTRWPAIMRTVRRVRLDLQATGPAS